MLKLLQKNRKLIAALSIILVVLVFFWLTAAVTQGAPAETQPATPKENSSVVDFSKTIGAVALAPIWGLLFITNQLLSYLFILAQYALNLMIKMLGILPVDLPIVITGWQVIRDIVNSFFILIILWIALTIVFNLERLGGKKLLFRVIIVALLVNFSLAIVTAVFAFTNLLARPMFTALPPDIPKFFTKTVHWAEIFNDISEDAAKIATQGLPKQNTAPGTNLPSTKDRMLASVGIPTTQALHTTTVGCAASIAVGLTGVGLPIAAGICAASGIWDLIDHNTSAIFTGWGAGKFDEMANHSLRMSISILFTLISSISIFVGVILFVLRLVAMAFIAILAPAAFLAFTFPGNLGTGLWNQWLNNLFKWAFLGPVFIFFLYLSFLMLGEYDKAVRGSIVANTFGGDPIIAVIILTVFMLTSAWISLKLAGNIGQKAVGLTRTAGMFALGAATGGVAAVGAIGMRQPWMREKIDKASDTLSKVPVLRKVTAPITRRADRFLRSTEDIDRHKDIDQISDGRELAREFHRSTLAGRKTKIALRLKELNKLGELEGSEPAAIAIAAQFGRDKELKKARPDLAGDTINSITEFTQKLHSGDIGKIDKTTFETEENQKGEVELTEKAKAVTRGLLTHTEFSPAKLGQLVDDDMELMEKMLKEVDTIEEAITKGTTEKIGIKAEEIKDVQRRVNSFKQRYGKYSQTDMARAMGAPERENWWTSEKEKRIISTSREDREPMSDEEQRRNEKAEETLRSMREEKEAKRRSTGNIE